MPYIPGPDFEPVHNASHVYDLAQDLLGDFAYPHNREANEVLLLAELKSFNQAFAEGDLATAWASGYNLLGLSTREKKHYVPRHQKGIPTDEDHIFMELGSDELFAQDGQDSNPIEMHRLIQSDPSTENLPLRQMLMRDALRVLGRGTYHFADEHNELVESGDAYEQEGFFILGPDMDVIAYPQLSLHGENNGRWHHYIYEHLSEHGFRMMAGGDAPLADFLSQMQHVPEARQALALLTGADHEPEEATEKLSRADIVAATAAARYALDATVPFFIAAGTDEAAAGALAFGDIAHPFDAELEDLVSRSPDRWAEYFLALGRAPVSGEHGVVTVPEPAQVPTATSSGLKRRVPGESRFRPGSHS